MKIIIFIFFYILSLSTLAAQDVARQTEIALKELSLIEKDYSFIRKNGDERISNFFRGYSSNRTLSSYYAALENSPAGDLISYELAYKITHKLLDFARPEQILIIQMDRTPTDKSLFRTYMLYSLGLVRVLDKLAFHNSKQEQNIKTLRDRLIRNMSQFINLSLENSIKDPLELIYLKINQYYYSNYDAEVALGLSDTLISFLNKKNISDREKEFANDILLDSAFICLAKCTAPSLKILPSSIFSLGLNSYKKMVADNCFKHCLSGIGWNPNGVGFYRHYLSFLRSTNDIEYEEIKSAIVWLNFKSYLNGSIFSFREMLKEQPYVYFKQGLEELGYALLLLVAFVFHYAPSYFSLFLVAFIMLTYLGKNKLVVRVFPWSPLLNVKSRILFLNLLKNLLIPLMWLILFIYDSLKKFISNMWNSIGTDEKIYSIALNILIISLTLAIASMYSLIDNKIG